jgi:hypothetical protein
LKLSTLIYHNENWSSDEFPPLDSPNTLVLLFLSPKLKDYQKPIEDIKKHYPKSKIIGCTTAGEIFGQYIYDQSLIVAIAKFEKTTIKTFKSPITSAANSFEAGEKIAKKLFNDQLRAIFVLSEGINVNGTELVAGLNTVGKEDVVVTGGLGADGNRFKETWSIFDGKLEKNVVVAVGFYGDHIRVGHGSKGGWDIFGPERRITRSKNNILYELDNKPALKLYKEYLGDRAAGLPATGMLFPLAIRKDAQDKRQLVRTILGIDETKQALIFAGDMPVGYFAQLMRANFDRLITGASDAGQLAAANIGKETEALAIAISCFGRRLVLGERTEEETESSLNIMPQSTQQIGFYSYGELSPYTTFACDLHNQTMTITTLYEE